MKFKIRVMRILLLIWNDCHLNVFSLSLSFSLPLTHRDTLTDTHTQGERENYNESFTNFSQASFYSSDPNDGYPTLMT